MLNGIEFREVIPYLEDTDDKVVLGLCRETKVKRWTWHSCGMLFLNEEAD